jgi:hypothetical protein
MDDLTILFSKISSYIGMFYKYLLEKKWSIFTLFIFGIVFYFIYGLLMIVNYKNNVKENWTIYKNNPLMLPIAGFFMEGNFFTNTFQNFQEFIYNNSKNAFGLLIRPIQYVFAIITRSIGDIVFTLNNMRRMARVIRELFQKLIAEVFEQLTRSVSTLQFYQEKFRNLMKKQYAIFQLIYYYLETLRATFDSMFNGPLPVMLLFLMIFGILSMFIMSMCLLCPIPFVGLFTCPICVLCFSENTKVDIDKFNQKNIKDLVLGDSIFPDQKVIGKFIFKLEKSTTVYKLGNAFATDSHIFYNENGYPQRIHEICSNLESENVNVLYCIATTKNMVYSGGKAFADYYEISNELLDSLWNSNVLESLNGFPEIKSFKNYPAGFIIENLNMLEKKTGFIYHLINETDVELYEYNGIICSGNNIVLEKEWIRVSDSVHAVRYLGKHNNKLYHFTTNTGIISIDRIIFRDFLETNCNHVYEWWNEASVEFINKCII